MQGMQLCPAWCYPRAVVWHDRWQPDLVSNDNDKSSFQTQAPTTGSQLAGGEVVICAGEVVICVARLVFGTPDRDASIVRLCWLAASHLSLLWRLHRQGRMAKRQGRRNYVCWVGGLYLSTPGAGVVEKGVTFTVCFMFRCHMLPHQCLLALPSCEELPKECEFTSSCSPFMSYVPEGVRACVCSCTCMYVMLGSS